MWHILRIFFDWSEVWAPLIPLAMFLIYKPRGNWIQPVKYYLLVTLLLNLGIDFMWYVNRYNWFDSAPHHRWNNNILYNLNAISRIVFFSWFFSKQGPAFRVITRLLAAVFLLWALVVFIFIESIFSISSYLNAVGPGILLIYCLYYSYKFIREDSSLKTTPSQYWIIGGLTLYSSANFFIYLFYDYLEKNYTNFLVETWWDVHNTLFIILCVSIAIAFYHDRNRS